MSVCPVCKYQHYEEVNQCQRCDWSMQDNLDSIEINPEHPILTTCIPTLVERLKAETTYKEKLQSIIQQLELQESNSHKLNDILDGIEANKQQSHQEITSLKDQLVELKTLLESKNNNSDVEVEETNNFTISEHIPSLLPIENNLIDFDSENISNIEDSESSSIFLIESDRNINNYPNLINEPQEGSLYNKTGDRNENNLVNMNNDDLGNSFYITGDRESSENFQTQQYIESQVNSNGSYHSFYRLIKNGELEAIKVAVPQETVEKIRGGTNSELKFVNDRKGNYWIVHWHEVYCLIPKEKININQYQYGNFQRIFNCQNYQETYTDIKVIEPATVLKSDGETWQLDRKGKIKFI